MAEEKEIIELTLYRCNTNDIVITAGSLDTFLRKLGHEKAAEDVGLAVGNYQNYLDGFGLQSGFVFKELKNLNG